MEQPILSFFFEYLNDLQISYLFTDSKKLTMSSLDLGLRDSILKLTETSPKSVIKTLDDNTIYHITDYYNCNYSFFEFPKTETTDSKLLFVGPYLYSELTSDDIREKMQFLNIPDELFLQFQEYYRTLPCIFDKQNFHTLLLRLYASVCAVSIPTARYLDLKSLETPDRFMEQHTYEVAEDPLLAMQLLEKRYLTEDSLLDAVAQGNIEKALSFSTNFASIRFSPRSMDAMRNTKDYMLVFNTLLRRTAYTAGVHPFYIDAVSSNYARLIEHSRSLDELNSISPFLIKSYCNLVQKHNMSSYSKPVRHILVTIDASLDADLSLKRFAGELFLNTSYLSALFKKEMGMTLTDYVNKTRITHAQKLLKSTTLSIQDIAIECGIPDIHYFTRVFRKETDCSPREWRNR